MCWEPVMLGTDGVRLPSPMEGELGRLKLKLAKSKADECLLSEEVIHPSLGPALPRGVEGMEGASNSIMSLREPIRLQNMSNMLELMGRVMLAILESTLQRSLHLHPAAPEAGEGKQPHLRELWACGDFTWSSGVDSLGQEGFLADVESRHFGVEVLELHLEPHGGPPLLLEHSALGDSTDVSRAAALHSDCLITAGSLTCW